MTLYYKFIPSPIGQLLLGATDRGVAILQWGSDEPKDLAWNSHLRTATHPLLLRLESQLELYFAGRLREFDLPLDLRGTPFQMMVWQALRTIPYGTTVSYKNIADRIGRPLACRAVGMANSKNPIGIVVPCHRVIGHNGSLTGFAGGLDRKRFLLALELSAGRSAQCAHATIESLAPSL